ncbi:MAG: hypothetical protein HY236_07935 [Acidobacteria bacterium]|nr:hypothetical protein [Acidobacteriota bacterium]
MPTVDEVLKRYVQALGGRTALEKLTSRVAKGTTEVTTFGSTGPTEIYAKAPNKYLLDSSFPNFGNVRRGFDGTAGWAEDPENGVQEVSGPQLVAMKRNVEFYKELKTKELYSRLTVAGKQKIDGRDTYAMEAVTGEGTKDVMYFDVESGLLIYTNSERESPEGRIHLHAHYEDYREVDGIKLPFTIRQSMPNLDLVLKVSDVKHNVPIEDAKFARPR